MVIRSGWPTGLAGLPALTVGVRGVRGLTTQAGQVVTANGDGDECRSTHGRMASLGCDQCRAWPLLVPAARPGPEVAYAPLMSVRKIVAVWSSMLTLAGATCAQSSPASPGQSAPRHRAAHHRSKRPHRRRLAVVHHRGVHRLSTAPPVAPGSPPAAPAPMMAAAPGQAPQTDAPDSGVVVTSGPEISAQEADTQGLQIARSLSTDSGPTSREIVKSSRRNAIPLLGAVRVPTSGPWVRAVIATRRCKRVR